MTPRKVVMAAQQIQMIFRAVCIDILDFRVRVLVSTRAVELPIGRLRLPHDRVDLFTRLAIIEK